MKKDQQQPVCLQSKVIELVKPRTIESMVAETNNEVEFLCDTNGSCTVAVNNGTQQDDLLF